MNLRLLAKAIAGQYRASKLVADEFLAVADTLATLTREEVIVIGALYRVHMLQAQRPVDLGTTLPEHAWIVAQRDLIAEGMDSDLVRASITMAQRTGLIFVGETMDDQGAFRPSPKLLELGRTVDFQDALRREGIR